MNITKVSDNNLHRLDGELKGETYWIEVTDAYTTPAFRDAMNKAGTDPLLLAKEMAGRITNWNIWKYEEGDLKPNFETISNFDDEIIFSLVDTFSKAWSGDKKKPQNAQNGLDHAANAANP